MRPHILTSSLCAVSLCAGAQTLTVTSPDGRNVVSFEKPGAELTYTVRRDGQALILPSRAGLQLDNRIWEMALGKRDLKQPALWMDLLQVDSVSQQASVDTLWHPLYGERSTVRDAYNAATLHLSRHDKSQYRLDIQVRAYNEGVAFRYFFPEHPDAIFHKVTDDLTEYALPSGTRAWSQQWAQAKHDVGPIDSIRHPVERPLTMLTPQGQWLALADADVDDWCLTKFVADNNRTATLRSVMYSPVDLVTYAASPWKVIITADNPGGLLNNNDIILNLNPPGAVANAEQWVKPGKIFRAQISTDAGLKAIDFCAEHNIPYMLFDWKWYEPCTSHDGDATQVVPKLDMARVIAHGRERGVGVWLYVNQHALMRQQREVLPLLSQWGVVGIKSGFVQYASHRWATWLHDLVRLAADNHLMMNIHDEFRPSGFSRTYPNLLTQEGICGNEEFPDGTHNCTLPFTRMLAGAADYTICYFDPRLRNTHAHQLAASIVLYSPLLTLFWYDTPERTKPVVEMKWFHDLETTFDDSRVLEGYPGEHIVMARRKGDTWFVGALNGAQARTVNLKLDFLDPARKYTVEIYQDGNTDSPTGVTLTQRSVKAKDTIKLPLLPNGGAALRIKE